MNSVETNQQSIKQQPDSKSKLHRVWCGMRERCSSPKHKSWSYYGGRGIAVCQEWQQWTAFRDWALSHGYAEGLKLDRIDNNAGYSPDNCQFVTHKVNCNNKVNNVFVEANGVVKSVAEWSQQDHVPVSSNTITRRIAKGIEPEKAMAVMPYQLQARFVEAFGERKSLADWSKDDRCVVSYAVVFGRLDAGWEPEIAMTTAQGTFSGRMRTSLRLTAWGETKLVSEWARDPRCKVRDTTLTMRIKKYGWPTEKAIETPSRYDQ